MVTPDQLAALATRWDAHPAKLVEAELRAQAASGDAIFGAAASTMLAG